MLIGLEMHLGFVNILFQKILLTVVREICQGEIFMQLLERSILQESNRLVTYFQFASRPLISKLFKSPRSL